MSRRGATEIGFGGRESAMDFVEGKAWVVDEKEGLRGVVPKADS